MNILDRPDLAHLLSRRRKVPAGEFVFVEGQAVEAVYVILEGEAQATLTDAAGKQIIINRMKPGEIFGELEVLGPDSRSTASVMSEKGCELIVIEKAVIERYLAETPPFLRYMIGHLCTIIKGWTDRAKKTSA